MKITDGKETVVVRAVLINYFGSDDFAADLFVDSSMIYDRANDLYHVQSVRDVLDYGREWQEEDPGHHYFDWEEAHDER